MILLLFFILLGLIGGNGCTPPPEHKNVILIGWDGTQRDRMEALLREGKLPNLNALIAEGSYVKAQVKQGNTKTKPGWSQILTGYDTDLLGVISNHEYGPIPSGLTVFERLKGRFGDRGITTVLVAGKENEVSARGPHRICVNCFVRFPKDQTQTRWWDETAPREQAPTVGGVPPQYEYRKGEPFFNALKKIDVFRNGLHDQKNVLSVALKLLNDLKNKRFFTFFHFEEPDEQEHQYGLASPEYAGALQRADAALGEIVRQLKAEGIYGKTVILLTTDHGQGEAKRNHGDAPDIFIASNLRGLAATGERRDVAPTILELYGFDLSKVSPSLTGHSLLQKASN